jgi:hypothetical protein
MAFAVKYIMKNHIALSRKEPKRAKSELIL